MLNYLESGNKAAAVELLFGDFRTAQSKYIEAINSLIVYQAKLVGEAGKEADATYGLYPH
ncbi:MAG: hypothetical protein IPH97_13890 [Ignavibacteriales bacterium]|nr:hypothetical protein [Ignavibacteriales bacterium]